MFVVRMSRFCIAISSCDCLLHTRWFWYFLLSGVWPWMLDGSWCIFERPKVCFPVGSTFYQMVNKTQVRNIPFSNRVFLAHMCPIYRKTVAGSCNGNQRWVEVMNHKFRSQQPGQGNRSAFRRSVAPEDFHLKGTSGVTRSLSRLYTGREQYETAFKLAFYF